MFSPDQLLEAYGDYRESIGRPRVNSLENIQESIPFLHFKAGVEWCLKEKEKKETSSVEYYMAEDFL